MTVVPKMDLKRKRDVTGNDTGSTMVSPLGYENCHREKLLETMHPDDKLELCGKYDNTPSVDDIADYCRLKRFAYTPDEGFDSYEYWQYLCNLASYPLTDEDDNYDNWDANPVRDLARDVPEREPFGYQKVSFKGDVFYRPVTQMEFEKQNTSHYVHVGGIDIINGPFKVVGENSTIYFVNSHLTKWVKISYNDYINHKSVAELFCSQYDSTYDHGYEVKRDVYGNIIDLL